MNNALQVGEPLTDKSNEPIFLNEGAVLSFGRLGKPIMMIGVSGANRLDGYIFRRGRSSVGVYVRESLPCFLFRIVPNRERKGQENGGLLLEEIVSSKTGEMGEAEPNGSKATGDSDQAPGEDGQENGEDVNGSISARAPLNIYEMAEERRGPFFEAKDETGSYGVLTVLLVEVDPPGPDPTTLLGVREEKIPRRDFEEVRGAAEKQLQRYEGKDQVRRASDKLLEKRPMEEMMKSSTLVSGGTGIESMAGRALPENSSS